MHDWVSPVFDYIHLVITTTLCIDSTSMYINYGEMMSM